MKLPSTGLATYLLILSSVAMCNTRLEAGPLFKLHITAPKEPLKAGAELQLHVTVTNTSDRRIAFESSPGEMPDNSFCYKITVSDSSGTPAPPSVYVQKLDKHIPTFVGSRVARSILPQESFVEVVDVTRYFSLNKPGHYTISVSRSYPPEQRLGLGQVESNKITVAVTN